MTYLETLTKKDENTLDKMISEFLTNLLLKFNKKKKSR
jgi:hypothetical protein